MLVRLVVVAVGLGLRRKSLKRLLDGKTILPQGSRSEWHRCKLALVPLLFHLFETFVFLSVVPCSLCYLALEESFFGSIEREPFLDSSDQLSIRPINSVP